MKILLLGTSVFDAELRALGHTVVTAGITPGRDLVLSPSEFSFPHLAELLAPQGPPDVCLYIEELGARHLPLALDQSPWPFVCYSIDTHLNNFWLEELAPACDCVLTTQKDFVPLLARRCGQAAWLPWSCRPEEYADHGVDRDLDIAFVGTVDAARERRRTLLELLERRFRVARYAPAPGEWFTPREIAAIFSRARIVVNEAINGEVNFRVFEALSCGALLLTERVDNGLGDLFADGRELVTFTPGDVVATAQRWLADEAGRAAVAAAGATTARQRHSRLVRAGELAELLARVQRRPRREGAGRALFLMLRRGLVPGEPYLDEARRLLVRDCDHGGRCGDLAEFAAACGQPEEALPLYAAAWQRGERGFRPAAQWGLLLLGAGRDDAARTVLGHIATLELPLECRDGLAAALAGPLPSPELFLWLGRCAEAGPDRYQPGCYAEQLGEVPVCSVEFLERGLALAPDHGPLHAALGDCYLRAGVYRSAAGHYLRALAVTGLGDAGLAYRAAQALTRLFRCGDALPLARDAAALDPRPEHLQLAAQLEAAVAAGA